MFFSGRDKQANLSLPPYFFSTLHSILCSEFHPKEDWRLKVEGEKRTGLFSGISLTDVCWKIQAGIASRTRAAAVSPNPDETWSQQLCSSEKQDVRTCVSTPSLPRQISPSTGRCFAELLKKFDFTSLFLLREHWVWTQKTIRSDNIHGPYNRLQYEINAGKVQGQRFPKTITKLCLSLL